MYLPYDNVVKYILNKHYETACEKVTGTIINGINAVFSILSPENTQNLDDSSSKTERSYTEIVLSPTFILSAIGLVTITAYVVMKKSFPDSTKNNKQS